MRERSYRLERSQLVPLPPDDTFAFFSDASNLEVITPPWLRFRIRTRRPIHMQEGTLIDYRLALHRVPLRWRTQITLWQPRRMFVDTQVRGPFSLWEHTHSFEPTGRGTVIRDVVRYRLPFGLLGAIVHRALVRRDLERIFDFRRDAVERLLGGTEQHPVASQHAGRSRLPVVPSGDVPRQ
jgi:ligand-binding SRPBCC domain-containing protein